MIRRQNNRLISPVDSNLIDPISLQLHSVFDALSDMIFYVQVETNEKFRYHFINKAFLIETGLKEEDVLNHYIEDNLAPESRWFVLNKYREAVLSKMPVTWRENTVYATGSKTIDTTLTPWFNDHGQCTHIIGSIRAIQASQAKAALTEVYNNSRTSVNYRDQNLANKKIDSEMALLMNNTEESFVLIDTDFRIVIFNNQFHKDYKEYFRKDVKKGAYILDYVKPTKRNATENQYQKVFSGETIETEYDIIKQDGSVITFFSRFKPAYHEDGTIMGAFVTSINISEKKKAENQIFLEKELSDTLVNSLPGIFYLYDKQGNFLRWNKNFETVSGYSSQEIISMKPIDFFDTEEKELLKEKIRNVFHQGQDTVEANFLSKDKQKTRYYFTGHLITYEGKQCLIGVGFDISEKIQSQELLQKINAHLVSAQQIAKLGYWELNLQNRSSYWSEEMYKICGVNKNKAITTIGTFINLVHPNDKAILLEANKAALTSNQAQNIEFRIIHKDGSIHHLMATINHIANKDGKPLRLEGTLQDITERKNYIEKIENQNKTLREIAWMQSHTVRAPLARIMGLVNLLNLMKTHPCPEMTVTELANQIVVCADELDQIIKKIVRKTEQVNTPG